MQYTCGDGDGGNCDFALGVRGRVGFLTVFFVGCFTRVVERVDRGCVLVPLGLAAVVFLDVRSFPLRDLVTGPGLTTSEFVAGFVCLICDSLAAEAIAGLSLLETGSR